MVQRVPLYASIGEYNFFVVRPYIYSVVCYYLTILTHDLVSNPNPYMMENFVANLT